MKTLINTLLISLFISLFLLGNSASAEPTWQSSTSTTVQLGVRDKYGSIGKYTATFIVTDPDKKEFTTSITVKNDDFGYVTFPSDFKTYMKTGKFTWKCVVGGKAIFNGEFVSKRSGETVTITKR